MNFFQQTTTKQQARNREGDMRTHSKGRALVALLIAALAALALSSSAQAKLTGAFTRFEQCPYKNTEVRKCIYSVTESGEVILGSKKVPIVNPVTLQGGAGPVNEEEFATFYAASNGITLSKTPQPVPGGLAGIVNCKEIKDFFLRVSCELAFENGLTGLNSTLELAKSASDISISESNLAGEEGVALQMPIKVHLENPFLGSSCYVGSSSSPIIWNLTSGDTAPPAPNKSISGAGGEGKFLEGGRIIELKNNKLVDNAWSAPGVNGCGGFLVELILNPIINAAAGLPAKAGTNTAILKGTVSSAAAVAVRKNDEENP
jgi:hypothetical protein